MTFFRDPRDYQISVLSGLLVYGLPALDFDIGIVQVAVTLGSVLLIQYACTRLWRLPRFDPRSALISGLSLCLLLRTNFLWHRADRGARHHRQQVRRSRQRQARLQPDQRRHRHASADDGHGVGVAGTVGQRRVLRVPDGLSRRTRRPSRAAQRRRARVRVCYAGLLFGRSFYLGEPMAIPIHRLQSGALLLFTFFMISDPRTTPDSRGGRLLFAALVAFGAWYVQFRLFRTNGLFWSLAACSLLDADHRLADARQSLSVEYIAP